MAAVQYTFTHKQYIEYTERNIRNSINKEEREVQAVPCSYKLYPDICLTTEEKAQINLS
jgi:hypothetical protein